MPSSQQRRAYLPGHPYFHAASSSSSDADDSSNTAPAEFHQHVVWAGNGGPRNIKQEAANDPGCAPVAANTCAMIAAVLMWVPWTYMLLPLIHETTPLAYSVSTALILIIADGLRRMLIEGATNRKQ